MFACLVIVSVGVCVCVFESRNQSGQNYSVQGDNNKPFYSLGPSIQFTKHILYFSKNKVIIFLFECINIILRWYEDIFLKWININCVNKSSEWVTGWKVKS